MRRISAGLMVFRVREGRIQIFLVHPGGPFFSKKDLGAWSIPKGEVEADEDLLACARREFTEETGAEIAGEFMSLNPITQSNGKKVYAWAVEGDLDPSVIKSNTFTREWPPGSGTTTEFPEVDRAAFFELEEAARKINPGQRGLIEQLKATLHFRLNE